MSTQVHNAQQIVREAVRRGPKANRIAGWVVYGVLVGCSLLCVGLGIRNVWELVTWEPTRVVYAPTGESPRGILAAVGQAIGEVAAELGYLNIVCRGALTALIEIVLLLPFALWVVRHRSEAGIDKALAWTLMGLTAVGIAMNLGPWVIVMA